MDGIFISYRRDDSAGYAGRLYDRLMAHFGAARVFMDVEGIEPGVDFVNAIEIAVSSCQVLIVIIGDEWTTTTDAAGRRRLDDPNDFIRLETGAALKRGIRVVPVLVDGAAMPRTDELPAELQALTRRQAIEISHKQWEASTGELIRTLEKILDAPGASQAPPAPLPTAPATVLQTTGKRPKWVLPAAGVAGALVLLGGALWFAGGQRDKSSTPDIKPPVIAEAVPSATKKEQNVPLPAEPVAKPVPTPTPSVPAATRPAPPAPVPPVASVPPQRPPPQASVAVVKPTPLPREARAAVETAAAPKPAEAVRAPPTPAPEPAPPAQMAVAPTIAPSPAAKSAVATPGGLPVKGESWTYRSTGKWPTSPKKNFQVVVQSVADGAIADTVAGEVRRSIGGKANFVAWPEIGIEFSPYLGAGGELARLESQSGFATPDWDSQWSNWYSRFKRLGQESVSVPAGTFNAHKIEVWSNRHASGTRTMRDSEPVIVHYLVWYAPEVKRYIKMQRKVISATNNELENDVIEMVAQR